MQSQHLIINQQSKIKNNIKLQKKLLERLSQKKEKEVSVPDEKEVEKLDLYFRYRISCLINSVGRKNYYLEYMKHNKEFAAKIAAYEKVDFLLVIQLF